MVSRAFWREGPANGSSQHSLRALGDAATASGGSVPIFKHNTNATETVFMRSLSLQVGSTLRSAQPASSGVSSSSSKAPRRWCAPRKTSRNASNSLRAWAWRSCSNSNSCAFVGLCGGVAARTAEGGGALNAARMSPLGTCTSGRTGVSKVDILSMRSAGGLVFAGCCSRVVSAAAVPVCACANNRTATALLARSIRTVQLSSTMRTGLLLCAQNCPSALLAYSPSSPFEHDSLVVQYGVQASTGTPRRA